MDNGFVVPRMATIKQTAELFSLPVHFIRAKAASGEIVAVRAGRKFLVNVESVAVFLSTGVPQGAASRQAAPQSETVSRVAPIPLR